eukprot:Gregarina_sp_Pseudo_9__1394@NODE_1932_length_1246_cov_15_591549_g1792_i0_p1_GENE_NODE_1932_length_1246_cov_15_591549_g1792_i0NODE_1932_length_1246_cov_15_591549_g1792_i0_p1_ORF_typecomplete_len414_score43_97DHH/PF01368_20/9_3e10_NODE_1932_length_1246_cov_15_591549_g1792_i0581242
MGSNEAVRAWLAHTKELVQAHDDRWHGKNTFIVAGNAACDLDSMMSSLMVAFYCSELDPHTPDSLLFVPIFRCSQSKYDESHWFRRLFHRCGMPQWNNYFFEDSPETQRLTNVACGLIMVDHDHIDSLNKPFWELGRVYGIIDHHQRKYDEELLSSMPILAPDHQRRFPFQRYRNDFEQAVGSCLSIVWDIILQRSPESIFTAVSPALLSMSLITLIQDTNSFDQSLYKVRWSDLDQTVSNDLANKLSPDAGTSLQLSEMLKEERSAWVLATFKQPWPDTLSQDRKTFVYGSAQVQWSSLSGSLRTHLQHKSLASLAASITTNCAIVSGICEECREVMVLSKLNVDFSTFFPQPHNWLIRGEHEDQFQIFFCLVGLEWSRKRLEPELEQFLRTK